MSAQHLYWNVIFGVSLLVLLGDAIQLIRENGFRDNSHYYHLGDGGHAYHASSGTDTSVYFKCVNYYYGCRGRAIYRYCGRFRHTQAHNHAPDPDFVGERHFRENILHRIVNQRFVGFDDVLNEFRRDRRYTRRVRRRMTLRRLTSAMNRARGHRYPQIPDTLLGLTQELVQNNDVSKTVDEEQNLYAGSITATDGSHNVAFFSPRSLAFLSELKTIQGDGTFKSRPAVPMSAQCFVIVTTWRDSVIPLGWILMERKTLSAYRAVFHLLKTICPGLNPDVIISDWEYAQQQAWSEAFPNAEIQGCLWHLCRAFVKKAQKLRLMRFRKSLPAVFDTIRKCCVISLLPADYFQRGLELVKEEALRTDQLVSYLLRDFFTYVQQGWIENPRRNAWMNFYGCMLRTNNSAETHNRVLRKAAGAYRPNIWFFIEALARLEHNAMLDIELMGNGGNSRKTRRWRSVLQDRSIKNLSQDLEMDIFHNLDDTLMSFIDQASQYCYGTFDRLVAGNGGGGRRRRVQE